MSMKKIAILTGAGISAESGLRTFRDSNGLWEEYSIEEVATFTGWVNDPGLVIDFYNKRRNQLRTAQPNAAHTALALLEQKYDVQVITQNVDDLHERGGSTKVIHLHGELTKVRSVNHPELVYTIGYENIKLGDVCEKGGQLRPHIVWFGEPVPMIEEAAKIIEATDILLIIGTSLQVYPAAGLVHMASPACKIWLIDPNAVVNSLMPGIHVINESAGKAVPVLVEQLLTEA